MTVSGSLRALALLLAVGPLASCGDGPVAPPEPFSLPDVDLSELPGVLRESAERAEARAKAHPDDPAALAELAFHYMEYDFPLAAAACLERAARLEPGSLRWHYYLGIAYEKAGEQEKTIRALEAAAAVDGTYAPALVRLGDSLLESDPRRAEEAYARALEASPENPRAHFGAGRAAEAMGRDEEALGSYRRAVELAPTFARAHYALAMLLSARGETDAAQEHLRLHARGGAPPMDDDTLMAELRAKVAPSYLVVQGEVNRLIGAGRLEEAASLLRRSMATDVTGVTARRQMGEVLGLQGKFQEAAAVYREVLAANPADHEARTNLGQALEGSGRPQEALREYRTVLESHPSYAPALFFLGRLLARKEDPEEGLALMRRAIRERPAEGQYRYILGVELARLGRTRDAVQEVETAARLMPAHGGARYTLGQLRLSLGELQGARAAWEEAVRLVPALTRGWMGLAAVALRQGDARKAVEYAEEGNRLSKYSVRSHLEILAAAYRASGREGEAAEVLRRAEALP